MKECYLTSLVIYCGLEISSELHSNLNRKDGLKTTVPPDRRFYVTSELETQPMRSKLSSPPH